MNAGTGAGASSCSGLEKAGLLMSEGKERHKHLFKLRSPGEYAEIEANLVTQMTPIW